MEAIKVIPEIIKVKGRVDARRWVWRQCFEKKMIIETYFYRWI
jgi:hypothetical protein